MMASITDIPESHTRNSVKCTEMEVYDFLISLDPSKVCSSTDDIPPRTLHNLFIISLRWSLS